MEAVRCSVCKKFDGKHCLEKKRKKVKANKTRRCSLFVYAPEKIKVRTELPSVRMPSLFWENKSKVKKMIKEEEDLIKEREQEAARPVYVTNEEHPLTGDLSRFVSSGVKELKNGEE